MLSMLIDSEKHTLHIGSGCSVVLLLPVLLSDGASWAGLVAATMGADWTGLVASIEA